MRLVNSCDNKSDVPSWQDTAFSDKLVHVAALKQAWRDAEKKVEMKISTMTPDLSFLESALPQEIQVEIEMVSVRRVSWHRIGSKKPGCDSLLGRAHRKFETLHFFQRVSCKLTRTWR